MIQTKMSERWMKFGINREPYAYVNQESHREKERFAEKTHYSTESRVTLLNETKNAILTQ